MTAARRVGVALELDRAGTPDDALARRLLAVESSRRAAVEAEEVDGAEERLGLLERGRGVQHAG